MKYNHFRIVVILLLGALLVVYTNCGSPFSGPSELVFKSNVYGGGSDVSYNAFEQTVYPLSRSYCISCHSEIQPKHSSDDVKEAHDAVISSFKVNFANIPASRLVAKLRDENHNCWGNCAENAAEMQAAIEEWNNAIKDSGEVSTPPAETTYVTGESRSMEIEFNDSNNPLKSNTVRVNIESAMLQAPMVLLRPLDGPSYLTVPNTNTPTLSNSATNAGLAFMAFQVPANGQYRIWGQVQGDNNNDNAFYVRVRDGNTIINNTRQWDFTAGSTFEWRQVSGGAFNLTTGKTYQLELRQREDGAKLSGFIVSADPSFNGQEVDDYFGVTLSFDLSPIVQTPDVKLLIDVINYDAYSYKFSRPRIISNSANVYVKGVKLLVNNVFNPQHSTYTIVDKIITPEDAELSNYSMIVLKDRGLSGDHIKFSFDQLAVTSGGSTNAGTAGGATGGSGGQTSLQAFQSTVYPISRSSSNSCVGCHRVNTSPRHASDNTLAAHDAALTVVDFNNPSNSRIVRKMRDERHNCQAACDNLARDYENAIMEWRNRRE